GGSDVRIALEGSSPALDNVRVWVQICGLVRGTPLVDLYLNGSWPRRALTRGYLLAAGASLDLLRELSHARGALLASPARLPPGLLVINVVGFPLTSHLSGTTRARHRQLAARGPNDGSTLLRDAIIKPGLVYPMWGADHYFRVPQASQLLYQLFLYLAQAGYLMPARKASNHEHIQVV
ncbi:MAG: hypothetical protein M3380_04590, partial [Chloroflexota bacterium]|nr:hypothetical protein [Chloroflexota bacterium]